MRREGHVLERVVEYENLEAAFWRAANGKRDRPIVQKMGRNLPAALGALRDELLDGPYTPADYTRFVIYEPKERVIHAPAFRDRVVHQAIIGAAGPTLERGQMFDSYACRVGKGQLKAARRAAEFAGCFGWYLKLDMRRYFDSISHRVLLDLLDRRFKDREFLALLERVISTYETAPGRGLPIGALTSQYFANLYLEPLDVFLKQDLRLPGVVRYMDDVVCWSARREPLLGARKQAERMVADTLHLAFKRPGGINRSSLGMDFLGFRIWPGKVGLSRTSRSRYVRKLRRLEDAVLTGRMDEGELQRRATALTAFVAQADSEAWRGKVFLGREAAGLEPRDSRRQLEQQRDQRALRQPEQEHADEPEPESRVPSCPNPQQGVDAPASARPPSCPCHPTCSDRANSVIPVALVGPVERDSSVRLGAFLCGIAFGLCFCRGIAFRLCLSGRVLTRRVRAGGGVRRVETRRHGHRLKPMPLALAPVPCLLKTVRDFGRVI